MRSKIFNSIFLNPCTSNHQHIRARWAAGKTRPNIWVQLLSGSELLFCIEQHLGLETQEGSVEIRTCLKQSLIRGSEEKGLTGNTSMRCLPGADKVINTPGSFLVPPVVLCGVHCDVFLSTGVLWWRKHYNMCSAPLWNVHKKYK